MLGAMIRDAVHDDGARAGHGPSDQSTVPQCEAVMTRVSEALRQAALVEEEFRRSSGRAPVGSRRRSPAVTTALTARLVNVGHAPRPLAVSIPLNRPAGSAWRSHRRPSHLRLGRVPRGPLATPSVHRRLVVSPDASRAAVEQYRRVAAGLQEIQDRSAWAGPASLERTLKAVLVTSALPGEGKTLTVVNLALTLSEHYGRRVLVIDADLRRSRYPRSPRAFEYASV